MPDLAFHLAQNLQSVRDRMEAAAGRAGRSAESIKLIAVTKYVEPEVAAALVPLGCLDLGESRPQDLWHKHEVCSAAEIRWHLIGHLQRNKVRRTLPITTLIHSVDSLRLLQEIDRESRALGKTTSILLEVNISGDRTKHGFAPQDMRDAVENASRFECLKVDGFMTMASREGDLDQARGEFRELRTLRDTLERELHVSLPELSMGMSGDFEVAIEEGATMVRVGSLLFEGVVP